LRRRRPRRGKIARAAALCYQGAHLDKFIKMPIKDYDKPAEIALIEACRMGEGCKSVPNYQQRALPKTPSAPG
jgi:hypothetical protein